MHPSTTYTQTKEPTERREHPEQRDILTNTIDGAMILAAGLGTRLAPLTWERPKPLVEVLGMPLIEYSLNLAYDLGAPCIAINTHHLHPAIPVALGTHWRGIPLLYVHEPVIQGTGGGARGMAQAIDQYRQQQQQGRAQTLLLLNADALIDLDTHDFYHIWKKDQDEHNAKALLSLMTPDEPEKYASVGSFQNRIIDFAGRTPKTTARWQQQHQQHQVSQETKVENPRLDQKMFCGSHLLDRSILDVLPAEGECCINRVGYPPLMEEQDTYISAYTYTGYFCDVGTPDRLLEANLDLLYQRRHLQKNDVFARFTNPQTGIYLGKYTQIHPTAKLHAPVIIDDYAMIEEGAEIGPGAVVGKHCKVGKKSKIYDAVMQSKAELSDEHTIHDAVMGMCCVLPVQKSSEK